VDRWLQVTVEIPAAVLPDMERVLGEAGCLSVTLADPGGEPILEPPPDSTPLWERIVLTALLPATAVPEQVSALLQPLTGQFGGAELRFAEVADRDWVGEWREELRPRNFGERLWICPAGTACPDPGAAVIVLEPGLAFGTGHHATTAMCLEWLAEQPLQGARLLDFGCGSGVLALAGLALGASAATAVDIDPQALAATRANAVRNRLDERLLVTGPAGLQPAPGYGFIVANILSGTLVRLAPEIAALGTAGARVALSGILAAQGRQLIEDCAPWFDLLTARERDGWLLITGVCTPRR
jgi:ribosomal protein L11 methyltransferase